MNPNVPAGAGKLLDLIGSAEAPKGYDTLYGNNQGHLPNALTTMSVSDIIAAGMSWTNKYGSSACGRYQFMTATLKSLRTSEHLTGSEIFTGDFQDTLGYALLERRGFEKLLVGIISKVEFGLGLAKEWASFPVLADCQGANRYVKRGETYYAGDGRNRALIKPEQVEAVLDAILAPMVTASLSAASTLFLTDDAGLIPELVAIGSDPAQCAQIRDKAFKAMTSIYGHPTSHNACACTLSMFLRAAGMNISVEYGAGNLAKILEFTRGWQRVKIGQQKPGDVAVALDKTPPPGADHIFLVIESFDGDRMSIADNQTDSCPHERYATGHGRTAVDYFLRATSRHSAQAVMQFERGESDVTNEDEDTNALVVRFTPDGMPLS